MNEWYELIVGTLEIAPELSVLVNLIGALLILEILTLAFNIIGSFKRL